MLRQQLCIARSWAILALVLALCTGYVVAGRGPAEISTSAILFNFQDMEAASNDGMSSCAWTINKSKGLNARKINFVLTIIAKGDFNKLDGYYYKDGSDLKPVEDWLIQRYKNGLQKCFQAAIDAGFTTIHILPHVDPIDAADGRGMWRNVVRFDPLAAVKGESSRGYTYEDVLLRPAAEALNNVVRGDTQVEFTLTGEQGLSVFTYPKSWAALLDTVKGITAKGKDASRHKAGVSFNWDKICGCVEPEERDPIKYNTTYLERFQRFAKAGGLKNIDVGGVKDLLAKSDFIGTSGYASTAQNVVPASHEVSTETVAFEFLSFGIDLKHYMFNLDKPFVYSEQGLGGCESNGAIASSLAFVAKHPFWGIWKRYETWLDPWQKPEFKDYRRKFYKTLTDHVQSGGGPQYRLDGVFLWSGGSWDVHGVNPSSSSWAGSFKDDVIMGYIKGSNAVANKRK